MISFLFKSDNKLKVAPIYLIALGVILIIAIFSFLGKGDSEGDISVNESSSWFNKETLVEKDSFNIEQYKIDENPESAESRNALEKMKHEMEGESLNSSPKEHRFTEAEFNTKEYGRRDPMKEISGESIGKSTNKIDLNYRAQNESIDYYRGVAIEDIVIDSITVNELGDNKARADIFVQGNLINNLKAGDYLVEVYYIKEVNAKKKTVTLVFDNEEITIGGSHIVVDKNTPKKGENINYKK